MPLPLPLSVEDAATNRRMLRALKKLAIMCTALALMGRRGEANFLAGIGADLSRGMAALVSEPINNEEKHEPSNSDPAPETGGEQLQASPAEEAAGLQAA